MTGRWTEFLVRMVAARMPGRLAAPPATAHLAARTPSILTLHKQAQGSDIGGRSPGATRAYCPNKQRAT